MSWFPTPSVADERAEALRRLKVPGAVASPWRHNGLLLRIVFSVLAAIAVAALFGFFALLRLPPKGLVTAAMAIGTAEWLIRQYRFFGTGLESSLWLCGTFAFIFGLPSSGKVEALLVFAAAAALSGWRMRNAFIGVLATVLVVAYVAAKWEHGSALTMAVAAFVAIAAGLAMRREQQRPSTERLFVGLALAMPVAGYLATVGQRIFRSGAYASSNIPVAGILIATALLLLAGGVIRRDRALPVSGTISIALAAVEMHDLFSYPTEAKLIAAGVVVAAIATALARALRGATRGFVITPVRNSAYDEAMQIGGIIAVAPHGHAPASHDASGPQLNDSAGPTDKSFGGAGSGGGF
jgi:hypothetical protein